MKEIIGVFLGAILGALFGYWFALYHQSQEVKARRDILLQLLNTEMRQIQPSLEPYKVEKAFYRDPIRINAPTKLLDGGTLEYKKDRHLIELLLNLNVAVTRHNDFVQMTNLAQATIAVPDNVHAQWYKEIKTHIAAISAVRDDILQDLVARDK